MADIDFTLESTNQPEPSSSCLNNNENILSLGLHKDLEISDDEDSLSNFTDRHNDEDGDDAISRSKKRRRVAHSSEFSSARQLPKKWPKDSQSSTNYNKSRSSNKPDVPADFSIVPNTKIRYSHVRIGSQELRAKLSGKKFLSLSSLLNEKDLLPGKDVWWYTMGVVISKIIPGKTSKGQDFGILKLSDLSDSDSVLPLFLFGDVLKTVWKTIGVGMIVGILNPEIMKGQPGDERKFSGPAFKIQNGSYILPIGQSVDMGNCSAQTANGQQCKVIIDKRNSVCKFHLQRAYSKMSTKRTDLHSGFVAPPPKKHRWSKVVGNLPHSRFSSGVEQTRGPQSSKLVTLSSVKNHNAEHHKGKLTTLSTLGVNNKISPTDLKELEDVKQCRAEKRTEQTNNFLDLLATPSPGSLNLITHLRDENSALSTNPGRRNQKTSNQNDAVFTSITAEALMKKMREEAKAQLQSEAHQRSDKPTQGKISSEITIARGLNPGDTIDLFETSPGVQSRQSKTRSTSKAKAIAKVGKNGIQPQNPNRIRKEKLSAVEKRQLEQRVMSNIINKEKDTGAVDKETPKTDSTDDLVRKLLNDSSNVRTPLGEKLSLEEIDELMKPISSYLETQGETEIHERLFKTLQKKEDMETRMSEIRSVKCKAVSCRTCQYTWFAAHEFCRQRQHDIHYHEATKYWFECYSCKHRTIAFDKYPKDGCRKCRYSGFKRTSMLKEKRGPKMDRDRLLLRGEETPFLNSLGPSSESADCLPSFANND